MNNPHLPKYHSEVQCEASRGEPKYYKPISSSLEFVHVSFTRLQYIWYYIATAISIYSACNELGIWNVTRKILKSMWKIHG
jgi:hypothetical protein